ncbi:hypothetical protein D3C77_746890 [compost metagenome]
MVFYAQCFPNLALGRQFGAQGADIGLIFRAVQLHRFQPQAFDGFNQGLYLRVAEYADIFQGGTRDNFTGAVDINIAG